MRSRPRTRLLVHLAQAVLSLAVLGIGGLVLADAASPQPAPAAAPVVYTPIQPASAKRPAPAAYTPTRSAPAPRAASTVYVPTPAAPAPVVSTPTPSATAQPTTQVLYKPISSAPAQPATPMVSTPTPAAPAQPPVAVTPTPSATAQPTTPVLYKPISSGQAQPLPVPAVTTPTLPAPVERPAPAATAAPSPPAAPGARDDAAIAETVPLPAATRPSPRLLGIATDVGLPDGANLGLVLRPTSWIRVNASGGTNSASLGFRGGFTAIPQWFWHVGPSVTFEAGYFRVGNVNGVLRSFFQVPAWMKDYAQQAGYTYYNAHLGIEFGRRNITGFIHAGASYIDGTVRTPHSVTIAPTPGTTSTDPAQFILGQDAKITVYTFSAKAGLIVYFGGP